MRIPRTTSPVEVRQAFQRVDQSVSDLDDHAILDTIIDAKGDLLVGTAADTVGRLAVGTNDKVLVADSGETTGLKWDDVSQKRWRLMLGV